MSEKLSALPSNTSPALTDAVVSVKSPGGTPQDVLVPISDLGVTLDNTSLLYNPYKFSVYRNSAQSLAANAVVNFDTKVYDTSSNVDIVTNVGRFTAPANGFYYFNAVLTFNPNNGSVYNVALYKNGSNLYNGTETTIPSANPIALTLGGIELQLSASDYIDIRLGTNYGGTTSLIVGTAPITTWFVGSLRSAT